AVLRGKHIERWRGFISQPAQGQRLLARDRMGAGATATPASANAQPPGGQIDVMPAQRNELGSAQSMLIGHQYGGRVTLPPAMLPSRFHQQIDLPLAEVAALNQDVAEVRRLAVTVRMLHGSCLTG